MPINYGDVVSYNAVTGWNSAGDGTNWQVNPARILQIGTATGSVSNQSRRTYATVASVQMKRTKRDSIFYAQIAARVTSFTTGSGTTVYPSFGSYSYRASFPTTNTVTIQDAQGNIIYTNTWISNPNAAQYNIYAIWEQVNGVATGSRLIYWNNTVVYSDSSTSDFVFEEEFVGNDGW